MEIEDRIRTRIEAIMINDARNFSEIKKMAADDEPLEVEDILADERSLYHRIINSYRNAVSEVNKLLEESIGSLSGFYRIMESIKEKDDFQEICTQIVHCVLQDFNADYCGLLFRDREGSLCLEGICEDRKFLRIHSKGSFLGSKEFEQELTRMAEEASDCLNIEDVYKEPRFNAEDFPGVVRSVVCLPILLHRTPVGFFVLSHSLPNFFKDNHVRVLKIIGSFVAHLKLLHSGGRLSHTSPSCEVSDRDGVEKLDVHAVALLDFDTLDAYGRRVAMEKQSVREIRRQIQDALEEKESVLFYGERELLVFMPGVSSELLATRIRGLREAFEQWQNDRLEERRDMRISLRFSVCEGDEDLARTLEIASLVAHPDTDGESEY
jgi:transcriptional regulator with GAF, ATPase, and Fis domain